MTGWCDNEFNYSLSASMPKNISFHLPGKRVSAKYVNFFTRDLIFLPFNVREVRRMLAVIVKPITLLSFDIESDACILYIDLHLSSNIASQTVGAQDRQLVPDQLLS